MRDIRPSRGSALTAVTFFFLKASPQSSASPPATNSAISGHAPAAAAAAAAAAGVDATAAAHAVPNLLLAQMHLVGYAGPTAGSSCCSRC